MDIQEENTSLLNNRYQLQRSLGSGGMAFVFQARDLTLERTVAIKILREKYSTDEGFKERFRQEAKAAANLSHPNIVTVYDFGLDNGKLFIVMEYVPGTDLKALLQAHGRFTIDEAIDLIVQACAGIGYAHRASLIHCDIKPLNMLVSPDLHLKVTDFGIARALSTIHTDEHTDIIWGSPQYFSPEQAAGLTPSPASDVYSLGVVLYELLTGQLPFVATDPIEFARLHRDAFPIPPRRLNPEIPNPLEQIILKVLAKEPSARYRTADQLGMVLQSFHPSAERSGSGTATNISIDDHSFEVKQGIGPGMTTQVTDDRTFGINWVLVGLSLLAFIAIGGLVPFWLYIYLTLNPPIH